MKYNYLIFVEALLCFVTVQAPSYRAALRIAQSMR